MYNHNHTADCCVSSRNRRISLSDIYALWTHPFFSKIIRPVRSSLDIHRNNFFSIFLYCSIMQSNVSFLFCYCQKLNIFCLLNACGYVLSVCRIEIRYADDCPWAYRTEMLHLVDFHAAFLSRAIHAFCLVAASLKHTHYLCGFIKCFPAFLVIRF